ncbi:unnamed protein product [Sphagnum compactum]
MDTCLTKSKFCFWQASQHGTMSRTFGVSQDGRKLRVRIVKLKENNRNRAAVRCNGTSLKRGAVGPQRFKESAVPGTYWGDDSANSGEQVSVNFSTGSDTVTVQCRVGENLLKVAEKCGVMVVNNDFCFEGSCYHCEMEVVGGAKEIGYRAEDTAGFLVRSCICPVPAGRMNVEVNIINAEDGWGDSVV